MLSQGCFLGQEGVQETAKPDGTGGDAKGQRFVSVDYTESSSPNLLVSKTKKQTPSWVVRTQMAPQSPQKENKGSDPNVASASREHKVREWGAGGRLKEQSLGPCPDGALAQSGHFPAGGESTTRHPAAVVRVGRQSSPDS